MAKEWRVRCKDCNEEFGYSDSSYQEGAARGHSRPERCAECRKIHNRQTQTMGLAYFDLRPSASANTTQIRYGGLGAVSHERREHHVHDVPSSFDPEDYGITDEDVRRLYEWFNNPAHQVAVVEGPTGSGKSTVLPFRLIMPPELPKGIPDDLFTRHGQIIVTQPRIQATRNIPAYVAEKLYGSSLGSGFDIGFRHSNNPYSDWRNKLVYVTDGTLINWIVNGMIGNLSVIMIDEAHERSLNIDLILGLLKRHLPRYPHLKLIIASATIDAGLFLDYFGRDRTGHIRLQGKQNYTVREFYLHDTRSGPPTDNEYSLSEGGQRPYPFEDMPRMRNIAATAVAEVVIWLLHGIARGNKNPGDILAFLHGERPIETAVALVRNEVARDETLAGNVYVCPLYTKLPQKEQNKALLKKPDPSMRRVVITTNVAETSLTVEDIVYVVDSGLINQDQWDPKSQTKQVVPVLQSQAGCRQRWGRAGRVMDGEAYCLYTKEQFNGLFPEYPVPQIQRSRLEQVVLTAKAAGIDDVAGFDWIQKPPEEELERAPEILKKKGALDEEGDLTELGLELQRFADEPTLANLMVAADRFSCAVEMATLLSMLKQGGLRRFLRWDRNWDPETRRAVGRIHAAMMQGCQDDLEFCLKLYTAWSEVQYDGQPIDPDWAFREMWVQKYAARLMDKIGEAVDEETLAEFRLQIENADNYDDIESTTKEFGLAEVAGDWLAEAETAIVCAAQEAWAKAYYISHSVFKDKVKPVRRKLLEELSGHKKDDEIRPIDFALLDRVRILIAYCLPEQICNGPSPSSDANSVSDLPDESCIYGLRGLGLAGEALEQQTKMPLQINLDSVLYGKRVDAFVSCKQQVITHRLSPSAPPEPVIHVSYLSILQPEWIEWLEEDGRTKRSQVELGRFIAKQTRNDKTGKLLKRDAYDRLFLDQRFSIGSRYQCRVVDLLSDGRISVEPTLRLSELPKILEGYVGVEPDDGDVEYDLDAAEAGDSDLADTILAYMQPPVENPEEDPVPAWVVLADDTYEAVENAETDATGHDGREPTRRMNDPSHLSRPVEVVGPKPPCFLTNTKLVYQVGDVVEAEVIDFDSPHVLLAPVPEKESIDVFLERNPQIGDTVSLVVTGYDSRPGDYQVTLVTHDPETGTEVLLGADQVSFSGRGYAVREIPVGAELQAIVENVDKERRKVRLSILPVVEAHLNDVLMRQQGKQGVLRAKGTVREISRGRVYLTLEWNEPDRGIVHVASVAGSGLIRPPDDYFIGEICDLKLEFKRGPSYVSCARLPEEIEALIGKQRNFAQLSWENGKLHFSGRMSYELRNELKLPSEDKEYHRAIDDLYRLSNTFLAAMVDTTWDERVPPVGTRITDAKVRRSVPFGAFVEIMPGIEGLVHKSEMSWSRVDNPEDVVSVGDTIEVVVIKVDPEKQEIGLSMKLPEDRPDYGNYSAGDVCEGIVTNVVNYGAFVDLEPQITGLLHESQMWGYAVEVGDEIVVQLMDVDLEQREIALSMPAVPKNEPFVKYKEGDLVQGRVTNVVRFGAFVDLGKGISGLVHESEMDIGEVLSKGDEVDVVILKVDLEQKRISLSTKQAKLRRR